MLIRKNNQENKRIISRQFYDKMGALVGILALTIILTGCIQRQEIKQGRIITQEEVSEVELGMNKLQVEYILGSPSIINPLEQERWEYVYILRNTKGKITTRKGFLIFAENKLVRIELDDYFK